MISTMHRWKPRFNERYYSIGPGGVLEPGTWLNDFVDVAMYKLGNCYPTAQEAEKDVTKWTDWYASDDFYSVSADAIKDAYERGHARGKLDEGLSHLEREIRRSRDRYIIV